MFKKANAVNSDAVHYQRLAEKGSSSAKVEGAGSTTKMIAAKAKTKSAASQKDTEMDQELVLYEFVEVLVRIAFWRANPYHGIHKLATKLVPLPDCLHQMLHEVVLPNAKRDDSALFKERIATDAAIQGALASYEDKLRVWFNVHTQSMFLQGKGRRLQFQPWQDLLKKGWGQLKSNNEPMPGYTPAALVGNWQMNQDSEITGDERCRNIHKVSLSMPQAKFAFINSQALDQMSVGQAKDTDDMTVRVSPYGRACLALWPSRLMAASPYGRLALCRVVGLAAP